MNRRGYSSRPAPSASSASASADHGTRAKGGAGPVGVPGQRLLGLPGHRHPLPGPAEGTLFARAQLFLLSGGHHFLSHRQPAAAAARRAPLPAERPAAGRHLRARLRGTARHPVRPVHLRLGLSLRTAPGTALRHSHPQIRPAATAPRRQIPLSRSARHRPAAHPGGQFRPRPSLVLQGRVPGRNPRGRHPHAAAHAGVAHAHRLAVCGQTGGARRGAPLERAGVAAVLPGALPAGRLLRPVQPGQPD